MSGRESAPPEIVETAPSSGGAVPRCPRHDVDLEPIQSGTKEQEWCGTWWGCSARWPGPCSFVHLAPSDELRAALDEQAGGTR